MDSTDIAADLAHVLLTRDQLAARVAELAQQIDTDYAGREPLMVGVLNGAMMVMSDLTRAMRSHCTVDWMAIFLFEGKTSKKSIILSIVYAAAVVTVDIFFFRLLKADFFSSANSYEAWNGIITLTQNMMSIFGFYSLPYPSKIGRASCRERV